MVMTMMSKGLRGGSDNALLLDVDDDEEGLGGWLFWLFRY